MSKIKLSLRRLTISQKIAKAELIAGSLNGNASFPTPQPTLATLAQAKDELADAYSEARNARQTAKEKTTIQNKKEAALDRLFSQLAAYVESVAGSNEELILSAGMDPRAAAVAATGTPSQPQALAAMAGDYEGQIDLSWDTVDGVRSYVIERSGGPVTATSWSYSGVSTKSSFTAANLNSGTRYWFRVAAVNSNGQSGWSDPATKIAP
jgi:hypothetical protein